MEENIFIITLKGIAIAIFLGIIYIFFEGILPFDIGFISTLAFFYILISLSNFELYDSINKRFKEVEDKEENKIMELNEKIDNLNKKIDKLNRTNDED